VSDEARKLADDIRDAKDKVGDLRQSLPKRAQEQGQLADQIARDLPKAAKRVHDNLDAAAKNLASNPENPAKKRELQDAVDDANAFIDGTSGLLPSAPVRATLGDLARRIFDEDGVSDPLFSLIQPSILD